MHYSKEEILEIVNKQLLFWIKKDEVVKDAVYELVHTKYPTRKETDDKFDRVLKELARDRETLEKKWEAQEKKWETQEKKWEAQEKKWEEWKAEWKTFREEDKIKWEAQEKKWEEQNKKWWEHNKKLEEQDKKWWEHNKKLEDQDKKLEEQDKKLEEQNKKWEEQNKKWEEQNKKWWENQQVINNILEEIKAGNRKHDQSLGAIGTRWGLRTEASFRNFLKGILKEINSEYEISHYNEYDREGIVYGEPNDVEIDILMKNGNVYLIEMGSNITMGDVRTFRDKIKFYEKHHKQKVKKLIVVSPMIPEKVKKIALASGMLLYSYVEDIKI